jgi:hypothetical protein
MADHLEPWSRLQAQDIVPPQTKSESSIGQLLREAGCSNVGRKCLV